MKPLSPIAFSWMVLLFSYPASAWFTTSTNQSFQGHDGKPVRALVVTLDTKRAKLRLAVTRFELGPSAEIGDYSVTEFSRRFAQSSKSKDREWVVVNGGFSSYRLDVPLGLVVVNGKVYSTVSKEKDNKSAVGAGLESSKYRWSGVLCERSQQVHWEIVATTKYVEGSCRNALQAGPLLVESGGIVRIADNEPVRSSPYTRTAICLATDGNIIVVLTMDPTALLPLARWMATKPEKGGLGCETALNLSGDDSSGVAMKGPRQKWATVYGRGSFPLPTVLIFEPKSK